MTPAPPAAAPKKSGLPVIVIILIVVGASCPVLGILAAIAIPNFIKFQSRSKQSECRTNLKAIFVGEKSVYSDAKKYGISFKEIGFEPMGNTRYTYFLSRDEVIPAKGVANTTPLSPDALYPMIGAHGVNVGVTDDEFTAACIGNIDNDATQDLWSISSKDRTSLEGEPIPAGTPHNDFSDILE